MVRRAWIADDAGIEEAVMKVVGPIMVGFGVCGIFSFGIMLLLMPAHQPPPVVVQCAGNLAQLGMTQDEVVRHCGSPDKINTEMSSSYNTTQQWVYGYREGHQERDMVYIVGGVVTDMQW
jgi:hypothetical protein